MTIKVLSIEKANLDQFESIESARRFIRKNPSVLRWNGEEEAAKELGVPVEDLGDNQTAAGLLVSERLERAGIGSFLFGTLLPKSLR